MQQAWQRCQTQQPEPNISLDLKYSQIYEKFGGTGSDGCAMRLASRIQRFQSSSMCQSMDKKT